MKRPLLWLALLLYLTAGGLAVWITPAHEGPDENDHAYYAYYLACTGERPAILGSAARNGAAKYTEASLGHHPTLYYRVLAGVAYLLGVADTAPAWRSNPEWQRPDSPTRHLHWLHGADEAGAGSSELWVLRAWRSVSLLCGLATLLLVHALARVVVPGCGAVADGAVLLLAALPQWAWLHGMVENGNLATTLCTAVLLLGACAVRDGRLPVRRALAIGVLSGLALHTKLTSLFLLPWLVAGAWLALRRAGVGQRRGVGLGFVLALAVALLVAAPFFWQNHRLYGDLLAMAAHRDAYASNLVPDALRWSWLAGEFPARTLRSVVAGYGWAQLPAPAAVEAGFAALALAGLGGWLLPRPEWLRGRGALLAALGLAFVLVAASLVHFNRTFFQPQGRYLFPALGAGAILVAAGLSAWARQWPRLAVLRWPGIAALLLLAWIPPLVVLRPAMGGTPAPPDPHYASMVAGLRTPAPAPRQGVRASEPADGAAQAAAPLFRWEDPEAPGGAQYSLHVWLEATGQLVVATAEWGGIGIADREFRMPDAAWRALPESGAVRWKVRRLPDRTRGASGHDAIESAPRTLRRLP